DGSGDASAVGVRGCYSQKVPGALAQAPFSPQARGTGRIFAPSTSHCCRPVDTRYLPSWSTDNWTCSVFSSPAWNGAPPLSWRPLFGSNTATRYWPEAQSTGCRAANRCPDQVMASAPQPLGTSSSVAWPKLFAPGGRIQMSGRGVE